MLKGGGSTARLYAMLHSKSSNTVLNDCCMHGMSIGWLSSETNTLNVHDRDAIRRCSQEVDANDDMHVWTGHKANMTHLCLDHRAYLAHS